MKEYNERTYRSHFDTARRRSFTVKYRETDLWIGVDADSYHPRMLSESQRIVSRLRGEMEGYLEHDGGYLKSLEPYFPHPEAPEIFHEMSAVCRETGIGPMSAVAGAVARYVALKLRETYPYREIIVENGGDIYADLQEDMDISVFAGSSPLSERIGLHIPSSAFPLGICTSSGTVGPSLSFGSADAVMIVCKDVLLADSFATAMGNEVKREEDIPAVIERIRSYSDILSAIVVKDDKMGITGEFELRIFNPNV